MNPSWPANAQYSRPERPDDRWYPDYFSWHWDSARRYRWRLAHVWAIRRCKECGLRRYAYLRLVVKRAWLRDDGAGWKVRSRTLRQYRKGQRLGIDLPKVPGPACGCLRHRGPAGASPSRTVNS